MTPQVSVVNAFFGSERRSGTVKGPQESTHGHGTTYDFKGQLDVFECVDKLATSQSVQLLCVEPEVNHYIDSFLRMYQYWYRSLVVEYFNLCRCGREAS